MLKYLAKISMDIFPSVLATIIGAYIVNHYINARPATDAPVAAAVSPAAKKTNANRTDGKPGQTSTDVANIPGPGVTAKGISERAMMEKSASEKAETKPIEAKPAEGKLPETASAPEQRRHLPTLREKVIAKVTPAPAPVVAPPAVASPPAESTAAPAASEEYRDANDLARAAIERLRNITHETLPPAPEASRTVTAASSVRPLPPPITVSTPKSETYGAAAGSSPVSPPYTASIRTDDPSRPTPPADIPAQPAAAPLDLRADAAASAVPRERTTVADDMLSAAKSMFHSVLPKVPAAD
jgi:hypothetical protein